MSFNLEQVRRIYSDPIIGKVASFSKRIAKLETENVEIESDDLVGFGDSDHSKVIYTDFWNFNNSYAIYLDHLNFDGVNDYVDLGIQTSLWSGSLSKFSFSCWALPTVLATKSYFSLFSAYNPSNGANFSSFFTDDPAAAGYYVGMDVTTDDYTSHYTTKRSTLRNDIVGKYYNITGVFDNTQSGLNQLKMYVDGVLQSNPTEDSTAGMTAGQLIPIGSNKAYLGAFNPPTYTDVFQGRIRDARYWRDIALTDSQVKDAYYDKPTAPVPNYWLKCKAIVSGNPVDSIASLTASLVNGASFSDRLDPMCPFEPDFSKLRLDFRFSNLGNQLWDYSTFNNHGTIYGEPCPASGSQVGYLGGYKRNLGWSIRPTDHIMIKIPTAPEFEMINQMSWVFRLNFRSLDDRILDINNVPTGNTRSQTLVEKYDDANDQYFIRVGADGNINAGFNDDGVSNTKRTSNAPIKVGQDHLIAVTYDSATDAIVFYVDGYVQPQTSTSETYDASTAYTDLFLLSSIQITDGSSDWAGLCDFNYIDMLRYYDDKVLTETQVRNLLINKFSISNIPEGQVALTDACVIGRINKSESFTDVSFTDTSFTT